VQIRRVRPEDAPGIATVHVRSWQETCWGHGYGRELMSAALDTLAEAGFRQAGLWVLDRNALAIHFYAAGGWRPDGAVKNDRIGATPVTELRYLRPLSVG
jgi:RimJ/RimL family protein N-acetyltransferase